MLLYARRIAELALMGINAYFSKSALNPLENSFAFIALCNWSIVSW
jgi:hypothetical protein